MDDHFIYPSQATYPHGATMCTPACYLLACGMLGDYGVRIPPTRAQMDVIMTVASRTQKILIEGSNQQERLFSVYHVLEAIESPTGVGATEVMGTVDALPEGFIQGFEDEGDRGCIIRDLGTAVRSLRPNQALLVTAHHHTTALLRPAGDDGALWHFDPMVARLLRLRNPEEALQLITTTIPSKEYAGLLVYQKGDERSTPGSLSTGRLR